MADDAVRGFQEGIDRRWFFAGAVFHIVDRHAVDIGRPGQRRADFHLLHRQAGAGSSSALNAAADIGPAFNDAIDQIAGSGMRNILYRGRDINNIVALQHTQTEIIEIHELHGCPSLWWLLPEINLSP